METFLGGIFMVGFNFAPRGFATCDGQILSIAQNTALFALLGTQYGGNGQTTFALPDLRGRVPMHQGQGPGLTPRSMGELSGSENTTLVTPNLPAHNHTLNAFSETGNLGTPQGSLLAGTGIVDPEYRASGTLVSMGAQAIGSAGSGTPFNNVQPYLVVNFVIALQGIFPSRN